MSTTVKGKLKSAGSHNFSGFRIVAAFMEKLSIAENESSFVPSRKETMADAISGIFMLELPAAADRQGPIQLQVMDRTGIPVAERSVVATGPFNNINITVPAETVTVVNRSADITLGSRIKYSGRGIDKTGRSIPTGLTVVIWARKQEAANATPVSVSVTSEGGYFSDAWPSESYVDAYAVISGGKPIPVLLENNHIPLRMIIVMETVPEANAITEDCHCADAPPRSPDATDLASNSTAFSEDPVSCVDFTVPNRTVEEVTYQAVVRTTQPEIKGTPLPTTRFPIPQKLLDKLSILASTRPGDVATEQKGSSKPPEPEVPNLGSSRRISAVRTAPISEVLSVNKDSLKLLEGLFAKAKSYIPGISLDNEIVTNSLPADEIAETILKERLKEKSPIKLEATVLAELVREKGDLTPRRLLQAEHTSVVRQFRNQISQLTNASSGRFVLSESQQLSWDELPDFGQAVTIAHGHLLTFKQVWKADGYSLGDLLYSLPLAPGQQKRISILDWSMDQVASRRANRTVTELLDADISHDRDVEDIIRSSLSENMNAESHADTSSVGGGLAGFIGSFVFGAAGGVASAGSTASQTSGRDVAGIALNKVRDRTAQSASAVRSQRSTVVQESKQGEAVTAQTEVVANYNHCHAMTVEYFEVLRHLQVSQEIAHVQECLFIPFSIRPFNLSKTIRW